MFSFSTDVPSWLKSLRLHKYAALFSQMSYEEMMTLTEQHLESQVKPRGPSGRCWGQHHFDITLAAQASRVSSGLVRAPQVLQPHMPSSYPLLLLPQNVTKGARHKIALSIQKLRERQSVLKSLEKVRTWYPHLQGQRTAQRLWVASPGGFPSSQV